ncbi:MAG TPA: hypothetical protein VG164_06925 [Trebonia sp.]|jgi:hypothetical protein|nr:hypothetical protein [Trebonia sp.]
MVPRDAGEPAGEFRRDRREHGGAPQRLDDDRLAELAEDERVEAGLDDFNPDEVPPATDTPPASTDVRDTEVYQEERAEIRRQLGDGELRTPDDKDPFPPTRYEE